VPRHLVQYRLDREWAPILVGKKVDETHPLADYLLTLPPDRRAQRISQADVDAFVAARERQRDRTEAPPSERQTAETPQANRVKRGQYEQRFGDVETIPLPDGTFLEIDELLDLPFRDVIDRFGWTPTLKDHALALRTLEDVRDKRIRAAERAGKVVSRELVRTHVISTLDAFARRLLTDAPSRIVRAVQAEPTDEGRPYAVRAILEKALKDGKADTIKVLRRVEDRANVQPDEPAEGDGE